NADGAARPAPRGDALGTWKWVAAGAATAALAGGIVAFVVADAAADKWNSDACLQGKGTRLDNCRKYQDRSHDFDRWTVIGLAAAGAFAATSAVLFVLDSGGERERDAQVACRVSPLGGDCRVRF